MLNWNYEERMEQNYGYCENESWGFYNFVIKKFELKNKKINFINVDGKVTLENLFNQKKYNLNQADYLILLNFNSENEENLNQSDLLNEKKKFKIIYRYNNCYLLKFND